MKKVILSLFDYSGNWPSFYKKNGYDVYQIDIKHDLNILEIDVERDILPLGNIYGILAAPPCTDFSGSGAQYWAIKDEDGRTAYSLSLVDKTLEIIEKTNPVFWALENPVGRLQKLRPKLGNPWYFQPYWYGDTYSKKTGLWGKFNKELPRKEVIPDPNNWIMKLGGKSERTKELRSMTPLGFAEAFYLANQ
jgi:site-specific DNA-cytosine methylase